MSHKKPTAVHERDGTLRPDRANAEEPRPEPGVPMMPHYFRAAEKAAWDRAVSMLLPLGVLTASDGFPLEQLSLRLVECEELYIKIRDQRTIAVTTTQKEQVDRAHPLYNQWNQATRELRSLWEGFGMDPVARTRVHTVKPPSAGTAPADGPKPTGPSAASRRTAGSFFQH